MTATAGVDLSVDSSSCGAMRSPQDQVKAITKLAESTGQDCGRKIRQKIMP
jgi:hypothetical protein